MAKRRKLNIDEFKFGVSKDPKTATVELSNLAMRSYNPNRIHAIKKAISTVSSENLEESGARLLAMLEAVKTR